MAIIVLVVVCVIFLLLAKSKPIDTNKVRHVEVVQTIDVYKIGYEPSGFVIKKTGIKPKTRRKKILVRTDIKFRVTYMTGKTATMVVREGSDRCETLLGLLEYQNQQIAEQHKSTAEVRGPSENSNYKPQSENIDEKRRQLVTVLSMIAVSPKEEERLISDEETSAFAEVLPHMQDVHSQDEQKVDTTTQTDRKEDVYGRAGAFEDSEIGAAQECMLTLDMKPEPQNQMAEEDDFFSQIKEEKKARLADDPDKFAGGYYGSYYTVGEDIPEGEYVVISDGVQNTTIKVTSKRHKKERVSFVFSGSCLVTLIDGDSFEIRNGYATPIDKVNEIPTYGISYMLKVGVHIAPGKYTFKQVVDSRFAIYYIFANNLINFDDAIDSDAVWGAQELILEDGNYVYIENARIEKIE